MPCYNYEIKGFVNSKMPKGIQIVVAEEAIVYFENPRRVNKGKERSSSTLPAQLIQINGRNYTTSPHLERAKSQEKKKLQENN